MQSTFLRATRRGPRRAVLCVWCKLHKFGAQKFIIFVQHFSPKTIDKMRSV